MTAGTTCSVRVLRWFGDQPVEGDFLRTDAGSCYRVDEVRPAGPRATRTLFTLRCTRLERDAVQEGDPGVHPFAFDRRSRRW